MTKFFNNEYVIDFTSRKYSIYEIENAFNNEKMIFDYSLVSIDERDSYNHYWILSRMTKLYPLSPVPAIQDLNGKLKVYVTWELYSLYKFFKGEIGFNDTKQEKQLKYDELEDKGLIDAHLKFELLIVKPSEVHKFNLNEFKNNR